MRWRRRTPRKATRAARRASIARERGGRDYCPPIWAASRASSESIAAFSTHPSRPSSRVTRLHAPCRPVTRTTSPMIAVAPRSPPICGSLLSDAVCRMTATLRPDKRSDKRESAEREHCGDDTERRHFASPDGLLSRRAICRDAPCETPQHGGDVEQPRRGHRWDIAGGRPRQRVHQLDAVANVRCQRLQAERVLPGGDTPGRVRDSPRRSSKIGPRVGCAGIGCNRRDERFARGDEVVLLIRGDAGIECASSGVEVVGVRGRDPECQEQPTTTRPARERPCSHGPAPQRRCGDTARRRAAPRRPSNVPDAENAASSS